CPICYLHHTYEQHRDLCPKCVGDASKGEAPTPKGAACPHFEPCRNCGEL
ncbi:hypothetical protein CPB83DRAFT_762244, partial [Crepidotus variabilis]